GFDESSVEEAPEEFDRVTVLGPQTADLGEQVREEPLLDLAAKILRQVRHRLGVGDVVAEVVRRDLLRAERGQTHLLDRGDAFVYGHIRQMLLRLADTRGLEVEKG